MVGNLHRPNIASLRPDFKAALKTLGKIAGAFFKGDDNLLRSLRSEIEHERFLVKGRGFLFNGFDVNIVVF